jgi:hypothetical protein
MTDFDLVAKKLALIETSVQELKTLARPEEIKRPGRPSEICRGDPREVLTGA